MFNIGDKTELVGFSDMKISHIGHQINSGGVLEMNYTYFGKYVSRGTILLKTKYGNLLIKFDERDGWARRLELVSVQSPA